MAVTLDSGSISTAIQQRVAAASHFTGAAPSGTPTFANGTYKYPVPGGNGGGLFKWQTGEPVLVTEFSVSLGAASDVSLYLVNLDANGAEITAETILINAQTGVLYVHLDGASFRMTLLTNQGLKLVTSAGGGAQVARVVGHLERSMYK